MTVRFTIAAGAAFLLGAAVAAPLFPVFYVAFSAACHQVPERCFSLHGVPLALCARCCGLYTGALAAAVVPVRLPSAFLWAAAAANAFEFVSGSGGRDARFLLAAALCWAGISHQLLVASLQEPASN
jgi:hypothetical protein